MTSAYAEHADRVIRKLSLINERKQICLQDEIELKHSSEVWWFMHTQADIQILHNKKRAVLSHNSKRISVKILNPEKAEFIVMKAQPLTVSPDPLEARNNSQFRKLAIKLKKIKNVTITILFEP